MPGRPVARSPPAPVPTIRCPGTAPPRTVRGCVSGTPHLDLAAGLCRSTWTRPTRPRNGDAAPATGGRVEVGRQRVEWRDRTGCGHGTVERSNPDHRPIAVTRGGFPEAVPDRPTPRRPRGGSPSPRCRPQDTMPRVRNSRGPRPRPPGPAGSLRQRPRQPLPAGPGRRTDPHTPAVVRPGSPTTPPPECWHRR